MCLLRNFIKSAIISVVEDEPRDSIPLYTINFRLYSMSRKAFTMVLPIRYRISVGLATAWPLQGRTQQGHRRRFRMDKPPRSSKTSYAA